MPDLKVQKGRKGVLGQVLQGTNRGGLHGRQAGVPRVRSRVREGSDGAWEAGLQDDWWEGFPEEMTFG